MPSLHDNSDRKKASDIQQSYNYLTNVRRSLVEVQRLGTQVLTSNPVTDAQIAAIDAQLLELRGSIKFRG